MNHIWDWFLLFRPWSYTATLVPFLLAAAICRPFRLFSEPDVPYTNFFLGLASGLLFQATVNLLNTWGDERSGVDDAPGAIRTTPQIHEGRVSMRALLGAALLCTVLAGALGLLSCFNSIGDKRFFNLPLLVIGLLGFLGATNYATGIQFKYRGLGLPFVAVLMGPLETLAACVLLRPSAGFPALGSLAFPLVATLPVALLVAVIMHGNDMRDIPSDRAAHITTPATKLGPTGALALYFACHLTAYLVPLAAAIHFRLPILLLPFLTLPLTIRTIRTAFLVWRSDRIHPPWRRLERASGAIHFVFGTLHSLAIALAFAP